MSKVDLGYSEPSESWKLESKFFPSKIGGKPAWLALEGVPSGEDVSCAKCGEPMTFLCQIYAPYEDEDSSFHRTLFVFICRKAECHERNKSDGIRVYRSNLRRENKFYSYDPPKDEPDPSFSLLQWLNLCDVCGCVGTKKCSKCSSVYYCSKPHQVLDWKEKHKSYCGRTDIHHNQLSSCLYPESEIVIEQEEWNKTGIDEEEEKQKFMNLIAQRGSGTLADMSEDDLNQYSAKDPDVTFTKFRKRVDVSPDQVLRYERGGVPLLISNEGIPDEIPNCEYCGAPRQFEFQIMPQMLWVIKEEAVDWGTLICHTCTNSCTESVQYKKEYIIRQDVSNVDLKC
ncbi:programmed cell death protein 2 [Coccinella septempunctata]|uniref:programmed cell death protein 2 n=1 Tax=Coccinella septempunctata TaxID=41139 RepID=UPI001D096460|nr:programmed cell death protein 2 [Coccinella septempunctata]